MRRLLIDIARRWRWLLVAAGAWSVATTLFLSQSEGVTEFGVIAYAFPLFYLNFGMYYDLKNGWSRVAMTLPVPKANIASALWVAAVLVLPGVAVLATLVSIPLRPLVPAPSLLFDALRPVNAVDLLVTPVFSLVVTNAMCLTAECLAETLARAGGHVVTPYRGWRANVWGIFPAIFIVPALALIGVILYRVPLTWDMLDPLHIVALAIGIALVIPSFHYKRWLVADVSEGTLLKIAPKPRKRKSCKPPSYWWSAWRWHVIAAGTMAGFWVFAYGTFVLASSHNRGAASLLVGAFVDQQILLLLVFFTSMTTLVVHPMRVYRSLPITSGRLVFRLVTLPAVVFAALLLGILPGALAGDPDAPHALVNVWLWFGFCLMFLAGILGWLKSAWLYVPIALSTGVLTIVLDHVDSLGLSAVAAVIATLVGLCGMYAAVKRHRNPR